MPNDWTADEWNRVYPPGTPVRYWPIAGERDEYVDSETRSNAWTLGHGAAVVKIGGKAGGVLLSHLRPYPAGIDGGAER